MTKKIVEAYEKRIYNDDQEGRCCLCGREKAFYFTDRKILSTSFSDYNAMSDKDSQQICGYCEKMLNNNYMQTINGKTCGIRLYSFIVENKSFSVIEKKDKGYYLIEKEYKSNYILAFTDSGKKHISWKAKEGIPGDIITVNTENGTIKFDRKKYKSIYLLIDQLYQSGVSKDELKECNFVPKKIKKIIDEKTASFQDLISLKKCRNDVSYNLIIDCLYKKKEIL